MAQSWTCPFCKKPTTITGNDVETDEARCTMKSDRGNVSLFSKYVVCPNPKCKKLSLHIVLFSLKPKTNGYGYELDSPIQIWNLIPESTAKVYSPKVVPQVIIDDYEEACKIKSLSPKSSATLSRRVLQGMIRNFWGIKKPEGRKQKWTLYNEIQAIKEEVDSEVWEAIDAIRDVGNIGAHMEENINVIIDVKPKEAMALIELIEMLIEEWYENRYKRKQRVKKVTEIGKKKKEAKKTGGKTKSKQSEN